MPIESVPGDIRYNAMNTPIQQALEFRFLSRTFAYPNLAFLPELAGAASLMTTHRTQVDVLVASFEKESIEQLQAEYTRLFINGYPGTPCPPYESVYREHRMHGESSIGVQDAYRAWDLSVAPGLIDHISTEFEFLSFLSSAESIDHTLAIKAHNSISLFMTEHLCRWVPKFIADLKRSATMESYALLGSLMESMLSGYFKVVTPDQGV
jgi:putative dimethyl sulfoxide reductase chaperone